MKNAMKILAAFAIVAGFATGAFAQQSDNDVAVAKAEVSAQVVVTKLADLSFGVVTPGVTKTIDNDGTLLAGTAGTGATVGAEAFGQFSVTKGANTSVSLAFSLPTNLINGVNNLAINFTDAGANKLAKLTKFNGSQTDLEFTPADGITTANTGSTAEYFSDDDFKVNIGGTVVPTSDQASGVYEGNVTLTATYN